jgi:multicomponent Na+:H+ antiporter subunit F
MSAPEVLHFACNVAYVFLGLAILLTLIRLIIGPTLADRILCLDSITLLAASGIGIFAIATGYFAYVDLSIAVALAGCLSTAAFARYLLSRKAGAQP